MNNILLYYYNKLFIQFSILLYQKRILKIVYVLKVFTRSNSLPETTLLKRKIEECCYLSYTGKKKHHYKINTFIVPLRI